MKFFRQSLILAVVVAAPAMVLAPMALAQLQSSPPPAQNEQTLATPMPSLAPLVRQVTPAVVNIAVESRQPVEVNPLFRDPAFRQFFHIPDIPKERKVMAAGSGVVVDAKRGYILTNNHVIDHADKIVVTLKDGRSLKATLVGTDPSTDVAVVKVPAENLTALPLGDSSALEVGDYVVAIGNPFGLGQTVTSGIVSATGRTGLGIEGYEDFIQTDASINPGNSGGALVNLKGQLVGINTAILAPSGGNVGIGFAVPINMAKTVFEQIVQYGKVERGRVGIEIQDVTPDIAAAIGLSKVQGALIAKVEHDAPAERAGLRQGDVILSVNGTPVRNSSELRNRIGLLRIGDKVELTYRRQGEEHTVTMKVARLPDAQAKR